MDNWQLPIEWDWKSLPEICDINPKRPRLQRADDVLTSFVPMQAVDDIEGKIVGMETRRYEEVKRGYTYFQENDVLMAKITPSMENGKAAIAQNLIDGMGFGTTEFHVFRPKEAILPAWIFYYIRRLSFRLEAKSHFRGAVGQQRVPADFLKAYEIPVPFPNDPALSLEAQRRIVLRLETLLGEVKSARDLQESIEEDSGQLLDSVIRSTFDGKENLAWQTNDLHEVAYIQTGIAKGKRYGNQKLKELPYLRVANVQSGYLNLDEVKTIVIAEDEVERFRLQKGDLLLTEGGDFDKLGRGAVWNGEIDPCVHQNHVFAVRFDQEKILPEFAEYAMQSKKAKDYFVSMAKKTTNLASINKTQLSAFPLSYPSNLNEQRAIVERIDSFKREVKEMENAQKENQELIEQLEHSFLSQVFRGEL